MGLYKYIGNKDNGKEHGNYHLGCRVRAEGLGFQHFCGSHSRDRGICGIAEGLRRCAHRDCI